MWVEKRQKSNRNWLRELISINIIIVVFACTIRYFLFNLTIECTRTFHWCKCFILYIYARLDFQSWLRHLSIQWIEWWCAVLAVVSIYTPTYVNLKLTAFWLPFNWLCAVRIDEWPHLNSWKIQIRCAHTRKWRQSQVWRIRLPVVAHFFFSLFLSYFIRANVLLCALQHSLCYSRVLWIESISRNAAA